MESRRACSSVASQQSALAVTLGALLGALLTTALFAATGASQSRTLASWLGRWGLAHQAAGLSVAAVNLRERLPWQPLLSQEEVQRAQGYYGSGSAMRRVAAKLLAGQAIKVVTLGGSITRGTGASKPAFAYASRFFQLLNASFPHRGHEFRNSGLGATTSNIFAGCTDQLVPPDVDLVVLEFTYNESPVAGYSGPARRAFELLLRRLLHRHGPPALLMLHHYSWFMTKGDGLDAGLYYYAPEQQLSVFANYYDFPIVSMRSAVWRNMAAGVDGFRVDKVVPIHFMPNDPMAAPPGRERDFYYADPWVHPADSGHQAMAEALTGPLQRALDELAAGAAGSRGGGGGAGPSRQDGGGKGGRPPGLPPPMIPGNSELLTISCAMQEAFESVVRNASGFEWRPERPEGATFVEQKWGWSAYEPGDWAELELDTRAPPGANLSFGVFVRLSHLKSYEHMGLADVECVSGCSCAPAKLTGRSDHRISVPTPLQFPVTQHEQCRIRLTISDEPGQTGEHKVVLFAAVVLYG